MVNTREIAEEYRLSHWAEVMRDRVESGLTIKAYCKRIGICGNTYYYWQRRVRAAACEELAIRTQREATRSKDNSLVPKGWAVCAMAESTKEEPAKKGKTLSIEIGKYRVIVESDTDTELLTKVCETLLTLC